MRYLSLLLVAPFLCVAAVPKAAPAGRSERVLRARVEAFYTYLVNKQYRKAEPLVIAKDRDNYYAQEKPDIKDFHIKSIEWGPDKKTAEISMVSKTIMRRARMGEFEVDFPYISHWKFENGAWWWYMPVVTERKTPFGTMRVQPKPVEGAQEDSSDVNLKEKIANAPKLTSIQKGVSAEPNQIMLGQNVGDSGSVRIVNRLPGPVKLKVVDSGPATYSAQLTQTDVKSGGVSALVFKRNAVGKIDHGRVLISVEPTQQQIAVEVK